MLLRAFQSKLRVAAWVGASLAVLPLPLLVYTYPDTKMLLDTWRQGKASETAAGWRSVDALMAQVPGQADVAVIFRNFDASRPYDLEIAEQTALRGAYALYPRKLRVAWDGVTIGGGKEIIAGNFTPDIPWLQSHQIGHLIVYSLGADGQLSIQMATVPAPSPPAILIPAEGR